MKKINLIIFLLILSNYSYSQESIYKSTYADGLYITKEDFMIKKVSDTSSVFMKSFPPFGTKKIDSVEDKLFFHYMTSGDKVTNVFAIAYKGQLFFQHKSIYYNRNKEDRGLTMGNMQSFVRVLIGGENYLYTEVTMANPWASGMIGAAAWNDKGVFWDIKNKEFNVIRNCDDLNEFLKLNAPIEVKPCEKNYLDQKNLRTIFNKITK